MLRLEDPANYGRTFPGSTRIGGGFWPHWGSSAGAGLDGKGLVPTLQR